MILSSPSTSLSLFHHNHRFITIIITSSNRHRTPQIIFIVTSYWYHHHLFTGVCSLFIRDGYSFSHALWIAVLMNSGPCEWLSLWIASLTLFTIISLLLSPSSFHYHQHQHTGVIVAIVTLINTNTPISPSLSSSTLSLPSSRYLFNNFFFSFIHPKIKTNAPFI